MSITGGASRRSLRKIRKEIKKQSRKIRRDIKKSRKELRSDIRQDTRRVVRRELRRELYSDRFARFLREAIGGGSGDSGFREIAEGLLNEAVRVETSAGPVSGTLIEVGDDYMIVRESPTTTLLIPFRNVVSIQQL